MNIVKRKKNDTLNSINIPMMLELIRFMDINKEKGMLQWEHNRQWLIILKMHIHESSIVAEDRKEDRWWSADLKLDST